MQPRNDRRRARAREGAALVQALIVGMTMALTLACVMMFARAYSAKIQAGQLARNLAWSDASQGCPSGLMASAGSSGAAAGTEDPEQPGIFGQLLTAVFRLSPAQKAPGDTSANAPLLLGGETIGFQTVTQFACNEQPDVHGDITSVVSSVIRQVTNTFTWE